MVKQIKYLEGIIVIRYLVQEGNRIKFQALSTNTINFCKYYKNHTQLRGHRRVKDWEAKWNYNH